MTEMEREQLTRAFNLIGRLEGRCEILEQRIRTLEGCGTVIDQMPAPKSHEAQGNVICLPGVTLETTAEDDLTSELAAMARRAWRERGVVILWPDNIKDARDREHVMNVAHSLYGTRRK